MLQRVDNAWQAATYGLQQMNQASSVMPSGAFQACRIDTGASNDVVKIDFGPVVFNVPERPNHRSPDLFIVVRGWLTFSGPNFTQLPLSTRTFGTEVGYFRQRDGRLEHVYGAHFDMDETGPGHPVFHVQFGSQSAFGVAVQDLFKRDEIVVDCTGTILGTVRTPTAQMDIFSVLTQICADHLTWRDSGEEVKTAFANLRQTCNFLVGAAHRLPYLSDPHAANCYRASHWYEAPAANA